MKPRSKMKKIMAYFLPFMLMFSFYSTALAQEEIAFAKTGCEATRGCVLKNGHAGECVVQVAKNIQTAQTEKLLTVDAAATEEKDGNGKKTVIAAAAGAAVLAAGAAALIVIKKRKAGKKR